MLRKKKYYKLGFTFIRTTLIDEFSINPYCHECNNFENRGWCCAQEDIKYTCIKLTPKGYLGHTRYIIEKKKDRK